MKAKRYYREDLKIRKPDLGQYQEVGEERFCIGTVFLRDDNTRCAAFLGEGIFPGQVKTQKGGYQASFRVKRASRYRAAVAHLYGLFVYNSVPWATVNTGYMDKFFNVYLESLEETPGQGEQWDGADVDYGKYRPFVRENMLPLWNVGQLVFSGKDFVVPCIDSKDYEHELPIGDFGEENGYLIGKNQEIVGTRNTVDRVVMRSPLEVFENWTGYKIVWESRFIPCAMRSGLSGTTKRTTLSAVFYDTYTSQRMCYTTQEKMYLYFDQTFNEYETMVDTCGNTRMEVKDGSNAYVRKFYSGTKKRYTK